MRLARHVSAVLVFALSIASGQTDKKKTVPPSPVLFPAGVQRGTNTTITLSSKLEGGNLVIDCPGVLMVPDQKGKVQVTVAPDAPVGPHLVQVHNELGASEPRWFSIGTLPEVLEKEPNDGLDNAQAIEKLPVCLNGQLEKRGTADLFTLQLQAGQTIAAGDMVRFIPVRELLA